MIYPEGVTPPSIITNMINFVLSPGDVGNEYPLWDNAPQQEYMEFWFLVVAGISVPWMLIPKPVVLICRLPKHEEDVEEENEEIELIDKDQSKKALL